MANINGHEIFFGEVITVDKDFDYENYNLLEYIEATGTQGVVTEYIPAYTDVLKMHVKLLGSDTASSTDYKHLYSCGANNKYTAVHSSYNSGQLDIYIGYNWSSQYDSRTNVRNINTWTQTECALKIKRGGSYCGNSTNYTDAPITLDAPDNPLSIFGMYDGTTFYPYKTKSESYFYGGEIIGEDGKIKCNLVPAERKSDGEIGLYDVIALKFYTNAGTGSFVKGSY